MKKYSDAEKKVLTLMICQSISDGIGARKSCDLHGVPFSALLRWCDEDEDIRNQYVRARHAQYEHWEQDILQIADETQSGVIRRDTPMGTQIETKDMLEHRKLRVQTRQWLLSKLRPTKFGDKMQLGGADDLPPIRTDAKVTLSPEDAYKKMVSGGT